MNSTDFRFRQVHLDFHTSEAIEDVGVLFDPEQFAATLEKARVNSVTCFARCHHGWIYFDTKKFPERRHPHLKRNLLAEQIEACHRRSIRVPIYITVQWDHYTALNHPEWLCVDEYGAPQTPGGRRHSFFEAGFYRYLCLNSPYVEFLKEHTQEVLETFPVDGIFFDIVQPQNCSCRYCRAGMEAQNLNPEDPKARELYGLQVINDFKRKMTRFVKELNPNCTVFYNAGHIGPRHRQVLNAYTHFEIESLPSGGWGYMHFPITQRYARTLGINTLGMTGKFHTSWGDFHSYKNQVALEFECYQALALNAGCSIGDQLHPSGAIDLHTYERIGAVYREVEKKEPYCRNAKALSEIGVFTTEEFHQHGRVSPPMVGVTRMLQEGGYQFDVIDSQSELNQYRLLILPDEIPVSSAFRIKLEEYLRGGGAIIASYRSGLNEKGDSFELGALGVEFEGDAPFSPDFIVPRDTFRRDLPKTEHVMYMRGLRVKAVGGSEILADTVVPYFNRTWKHFCSHRYTPSKGEVLYPAIIRNRRCIYFAHPIFSQYNSSAPRWCKTLVHNAVNLLMPNPVLKIDAPSTVVATLNEQSHEARWILHLLHYIPERRSEAFDVLEDVIPLYEIPVKVRTQGNVSSIRIVPEMQSLEFTDDGEYISFIVPEVRGHVMVSIEYQQ